MFVLNSIIQRQIKFCCQFSFKKQQNLSSKNFDTEYKSLLLFIHFWKFCYRIGNFATKFFRWEGGQKQVQSFLLKILLSLVIIKISNLLPPTERKRKKLKSRNLAFLHDLLQPRFVQNFGSLCYADFEILGGHFLKIFSIFTQN